MTSEEFLLGPVVLLQKLGIEVTSYNFKYDHYDYTNMGGVSVHVDESLPVMFELMGGFYPQTDVDEFIELIQIINAAKKSDNVIVKDLLSKLKMAVELTEEK